MARKNVCRGSASPAAALQFFMTCTLFVFFCSPLLWWRARPYGAEGPAPWENHFACVQGTSQCALLPVSALSSPPSASLAGAYDQTCTFPEAFCFLEEFDTVNSLIYVSMLHYHSVTLCWITWFFFLSDEIKDHCGLCVGVLFSRSICAVQSVSDIVYLMLEFEFGLHKKNKKKFT